MNVPRDLLGDSLPLQGRLLIDEPMASHNSWRAGGKADRFYLPESLDDLCRFLRGMPADEPLLWLGLGSNLLIRDGGIRGTVLCTLNRLKRLELLPGQVVRVEAGVPCAHVAKFSADKGLVGAEFLAGIPGTMGGIEQYTTETNDVAQTPKTIPPPALPAASSPAASRSSLANMPPYS